MTRIHSGSSANLLGRITPGGVCFTAKGLSQVSAHGGVELVEAPGGAGRAIRFGPSGRIAWKSNRLIAPPSGAIALDFTYSATSYSRDETVLRVSDSRAKTVLAVTIGRVMLKVLAPPRLFAIDLYLNERENDFLRLTLSWELIGSGRMYFVTAVNDRVYDRAIVKAFRPGVKFFSCAPRNCLVREISFFPSPIPPPAHPHRNARTAANPDSERTRRLGFFSRAETRAIARRGGLAVYLPEGGRANGIINGLRTAGLASFAVASERNLPQILERAAVLIMPDNDAYPSDPRLGEAVRSFAARGGGILALGTGAFELRRIGMVTLGMREFGVEGRNFIRPDKNSAILKGVPFDWIAGQDLLNMRVRRGPHFLLPPGHDFEVLAVHPLTNLPCAVASAAGRGRVILCSCFPFGYYFNNPSFDLVGGTTANAGPYIFFKSLILHAARVPFRAPSLRGAPGKPAGFALIRGMAAPTRPSRLASEPLANVLDRDARETAADVGGAIRIPENKHLCIPGTRIGPAGFISGWFKTGTAGIAGVETRNILLLGDGAENSWQMRYSPLDHALEFAASSPNGETLLVAGQNVAWHTDARMHICLQWKTTTLREAAIELFIDGRPAAIGGAPLPTRPMTRATIGAVPGMRGLDLEVSGLEISPGPPPDLRAVRRLSCPPARWTDTPAEKAALRQFLRTRRLALLADNMPQFYLGLKRFKVYGVPFDVLFEKDILSGALSPKRYSLLYAPGGGLPDFKAPKRAQNLIRRFVAAGGGYVGICAGLNEASSNWPAYKSARLFKTPLANYPGISLVDIELDGESSLLRGLGQPGTIPRVRFMHMSGSPIDTGRPGADVEQVINFAHVPRLAACGAFQFGRGRGVVWCPHPEVTKWGWWEASDRTRHVMRRLFINSLYYAARFIDTNG